MVTRCRTAYQMSERMAQRSPASELSTTPSALATSVVVSERAARSRILAPWRRPPWPTVTTDVHENTLAVPKKAMVPEAGATFLFVAESDTVRKVPVETGYADDRFIEILAGLDEGDTVVTVGQGGLRHGARIRDLAARSETTTEVASADGAVDSSDAGDR